MPFDAVQEKEYLIKRIALQLSALLFAADDERTCRVVGAALRNSGIETDVCNAIDIALTKQKAHIAGCVAAGVDW